MMGPRGGRPDDGLTPGGVRARSEPAAAAARGLITRSAATGGGHVPSGPTKLKVRLLWAPRTVKLKVRSVRFRAPAGMLRVGGVVILDDAEEFSN